MTNSSDKANSPNASDRNRDLYKEGCALFDARMFSKAKAKFQEALEYWPEDWQAWMALGNCHDGMKNSVAAEKSFREALKHCEIDKQECLWFNLGNALFDQQRWSESIDCYTKLDPGTDLGRKAARNVQLAKSRLNK